ncbi:unnamed protein product [Rotaria sp. Silwood1]|nr:unnamed protein product [Rotaria sp. Silwood1]CAF1533521.1 unnamed protein product [Rotaria sp. Silwood1]CAF1535038.1 unnamed protein product [Rotaria sp. Silwood1]CAF3678669.1 unnamed protein product [Rotaria sp. Silwood1]CAF3743663.1 unnamed protein product [Rotaria sp. Silwood1]
MHILHYQQILFIFITIIKNSHTFWWSLGLPSFQLWTSFSKSNQSLEQKQFCSSLTFLTFEQRSYCQINPKIFSIINYSLRIAIDECQYQFRNQRWNCSLFNQPKIFEKLILRKTPETAFIYALTSAAIMHSIAKACSKGELIECGCDKSQPKLSTNTTITPSLSLNDGFEWGGCSDDLKFGRKISMSFIDKQETLITRRRVIRMVNLHNNEAGRQIVERNVQLTCKCHGVSGSCTLRVCWRTLPDFRLIGSELRTKYSSATQIRYNRRLNILKPRKNIQKLFNTTDLIYIHMSPSYCEKNFQLGSLGTQGRQCNLTINEPGSCSILCCDRGYETIVDTIEEDCDCQFYWCCEVRCKRCIKKIEKHFCK